MKKFFAFFALIALSSIANASVISWGATGSDSGMGALFENGTAYLIEVKDGGPTLAQMVATIKTNGLGTTNANVTSLDSATIGSYDGEVDVWVGNPATILENETSTYYVVMVDSASENFIITHGLTIADPEFEYSSNPPIVLSSPYFEESNGSWAATSGKVGGENVPEPTVLALLALGVAGVALRRKKMA